MRYIADLHIHSHYSRATSKSLNPVSLTYWAKIKGVNVVGTGDFTHPGWTEELKQALEPAEPGLFKLKPELFREKPKVAYDIPVRFMLTAEISNIYKKNGKVRKVHNVVFAPDFETVEKIQKQLQKRKFNITSDGRPILGMDSRDLLEMLLNIDRRIVLVPAHIWTPWFAVLGSKSGFDSIEECFEDMTEYIFAVETGLSSDQPLNWLCSFLDRFTLMSNSDAHSPEKLGRNANIFNTDLSYYSIIEALKNQQSDEFIGTIDMYPQEGKYHYDGHRKCGVRFNPVETLEHQGICPVCGKPLTLGVAHRIASLADRDDPLQRPVKKQFHYIIPLKEIIAEIYSTSSTTVKVKKIYDEAIYKLGNETDILLFLPLEEIDRLGNKLLTEAISRMRAGKVLIEEGFDGQYGKIKLFAPGEIQSFASKTIFTVNKPSVEQYSERPLLNFDVKRFRQLKQQLQNKQPQVSDQNIKQTLNQQQQAAVEHFTGPALILAGPGTGKTRILTERIAYLVEHRNIQPESIVAVTFTRQAAREMQKRLVQRLGQKAMNICIDTFHALGLSILEQALSQKFKVITDFDKHFILKQLNVPANRIDSLLRKISNVKNGSLLPENLSEEELYFWKQYENFKQQHQLFDFDDLMFKTVDLLKTDTAALQHYQEKFQWINIDEFQDINPIQYEFVKTLFPKKDSNIFAIGDPNQSIYGFRGSSVELLEKFKQEYEPKIYSISVSYRVPQTILNASVDILGTKTQLQGIHNGINIAIVENATDKSEAEFIARKIEDMIGGVGFFSIDSAVTGGEKSEFAPSDFAILTRTKEQFAPIIKAMNDHSIPYQVIGTEPEILQGKNAEIIDLLRYISNPHDEFVKDKIKSLSLLHITQVVNTNVDLTELIRQLGKILKADPEQLEKLLWKAEEYKNIEDFLREVELMNSGQEEYNQATESVRIMTMHASKGLEFRCVIIPGVEQGIIPYTIYKKDVDLQEERRLLYVAMTRAKDCLIMSYAKARNFKNRIWHLKPSSFLAEISKELLDFKKLANKRQTRDKQLGLFE